MRVVSSISSNSRQENVFLKMSSYSFNVVSSSASCCSCSKMTAQSGAFCDYFLSFIKLWPTNIQHNCATWMHHKYLTYIWGKLTAAAWWCHAVCVMWIIRDVATELRRADTCIHMHTYTLPHTLFGSGINHSIFGSFRGGSEKPFQLQKDFFPLTVYSSLLLRD